MNPITAAFERNMERFANRFGLVESKSLRNTDEQEPNVSQAATAAVKTAESESRGNPNQTQNDAGDYGTASEALNAQKTETKGAAPDGTDERGSRNDSANFQDKSYTLNGSARLAAVATADVARGLMAAGKISEAAALFRRIAAEGDLATSGPEVGAAVGGKPDAVSAVEDAAAPSAELPAAETPTGGGAPADNLMQAEIQRKLNELSENKKVTTEVMTQLEDVLKGTGMSASAAKEAISRMAKHAAALATIKSAGDLVNPVGNPAGTGKPVGNGTKANSVKSVPSTGQASNGGSGAAGTAATASRKQAGSSDTKNSADIKPTNVPPSSMQDQGEKKYDLADGDPDESIRRQANNTAATDDKTHTGQELHDAGDYKLGQKEVDWSLYDQIGKSAAVNAPAKRPVAAKAPPVKQADARSPDAANAASGGDETTRYEKPLQGDTSDDEISDGNVETLASPETEAVASEAQRDLDRQHNMSTRGNTMASAVRPQDRKAVEARLAAFEAASKQLSKAATLLVERKTAAKAPAVSATRDILQAIRTAEANLKKLLAMTSDNKAAVASFMQTLASLPGLTQQAKFAVGFIDSVVQTERVALAKLNRVGPAFKLATQQFEWGQIRDVGQLHQKLAEYIRMPADGFAAVASTAESIGDIGRRTVPGMNRQAVRRMPSVVTAQPADLQGSDPELDTMWDD